LFYYTAKVTL